MTLESVVAPPFIPHLRWFHVRKTLGNSATDTNGYRL